MHSIPNTYTQYTIHIYIYSTPYTYTLYHTHIHVWYTINIYICMCTIYHTHKHLHIYNMPYIYIYTIHYTHIHLHIHNTPYTHILKKKLYMGRQDDISTWWANLMLVLGLIETELSYDDQAALKTMSPLLQFYAALRLFHVSECFTCMYVCGSLAGVHACGYSCMWAKVNLRYHPSTALSFDTGSLTGLELNKDILAG